jgi:hypothetical protein
MKNALRVWVPMVLACATAAADPTAPSASNGSTPGFAVEAPCGGAPSQVVPTAQAAPAPTSRRGWKIAAWTAVGVSALGVVVSRIGVNEINDATTQLCHGGAYGLGGGTGCLNPQSVMYPLSRTQVAALNAEGEQGKVLGDVGVATALASGVFAVVALYEGYLAHDARKAERIVIAPVVAPGTGGAQLQLHW